MTQTPSDIENTNHSKAKIAKMSTEQLAFLNERALVTLLFIYSEGESEFSTKTIEEYPALGQRNRIMHRTVGDYMILDLLRDRGYLDGESNRSSRWYKIFLTDKGLAKAKQLHSSFIKSSNEILIAL